MKGNKEMKNFTSLFHVSLFVNDIKASLDYYKKLGFEEMFGITENEGDEPWDIYLKITHGQYLELQPVKSNNPHPHPDDAKYYDNQTVWHFALETQDIRTMIEDLTNKGVTVWKDPEKNGVVKSIDDVHHSEDGCLVAWLIDPDGTPIEVMEQVGQTRQRLHDPE